MGSQLFEVLRQGVWASLTGGWFHDPRQPTLTNTIHLYLWLILLAFPLTLCVYFTSNVITWTAYTGSIGVLFLVIKLLNWRFHYLFDTSDAIEEMPKEDITPDNKPDLSFEAKLKRERPKNLGLAEADEIELQVLDCSRTKGRMTQTQCLLEMEDISPPVATGTSGIGGDFKVDVHRKESSSSSPNSCHSITNDSWKIQSHPDVCNNLGDSIKQKTEDTSVLVENAQGQQKDDLEELSISCSIPIPMDDNNSPTSQEPSISSADVAEYPRGGKRFPNPQSELARAANTTNNLKETTSLELGFVLSHKEPQIPADGTTQEFRRTQSAQETSTKETRRETLLRSQPTSSSSNIIGGRPPNKKLEALVAISLQSIPSEKVVCLKRSKSEEVKLKPSEPCEESENDEEDEMDEGLRCRTPLLHRSGEAISRKEEAPSIREPPKPVVGGKKSRLLKKVSFITRSSSESDHDAQSPVKVERWREVAGDGVLPQSAEGHQTANVGEKKFALVPSEDSLVGWNQSGGPFTSQWLFQAVNPMPHRDPATTSRQNSDTASREEKGETESVKSEDSDGNNSFLGISKLFEIEDEENSMKESSKPEKQRKVKPSKVHTRPPPKKPPRNVHPGKVMGITPRMLLSGDEDTRRRQLLRRPRAVETETSFAGGSVGSGWRQERETSPRVLERLLEENQEHGPLGFGLHHRAAGPSATFRDISQEGTHNWTELDMVDIGGHGHGPYIWPEGEIEGTGGSFRNPTTSRLPRGREIRSSSDGHASSNPFLQSAREIKNHLRSLSGTQNSLDISGIVDRQGQGGSRTHNQLEGLFRARDESQQPDPSNPASVNRHRRLRRLAQSRRTLERRREMPSVLYKLGTTHLANSHDDTTEGALHHFQDENGDWYSYTFSEKGVGCVVQAEPPLPPSPRTPCLSTILNRIDLGASAYLEPRAGPSSASAHPVASTSRQSAIIKTPSSSESWSSVSSSELAVDPTNHKLYSTYHHHRRGLEQVQLQQRPRTSTSPIETLNFHYEPSIAASLAQAGSGRTSIQLPGGIGRPWQRNPRDVLSVLTESFLERRRLPSGPYSTGDRMGSNVYPLTSDPNTSKKNAKYFYWMNPVPFVSSLKLKVPFDRLNLMAIFDRSRSFFENLLAILLAIGVASLGSFMLHTGYFQDLTMVLLCFVIASCQFSLLKSVQPDAASPTHGFNRIVAFSRPIYFCLCGSLVFLIQNTLDRDSTDFGWNIYGIDVTNRWILTGIRDLILIVILAFPVLFCVGIFPQVNTFCIFLLEQMDIHIFGGNAAASLFDAGISNVKNWIAVGCLYGFVYGALAEKEGTQHLLFSIFCALLVPLAYHMSRCSSDATIMWGLLRQHLCPDEDCFGESTSASAKQKEAEDHGDPLPKKLQSTVNARLKSDTITCPVLAILIFALHSSTVFTALQPGLLPVFWVVAIGFGFLLHYVMPQFRKQMPCLLVAHPVLLSAEYNQFETREAAKMMWFEKFYIVACFLERNILYPLLFVSALTQEAATVVREDRFDFIFGSLLVTVTALKALRTSYSDPSKHYLILTFTILFFKFDWEGSSETFVVDFFFISILFHKIFELWLKLQFVTSYISPWQISWGSAFHAFAQPFSVPHSAMLFLQAFISSVFSAPLNPFLGSAIFITSYVRPIKFWERDYNTKRVDHSNTRLSAHLEKNPGADDNNLNSIFYEHLTRSLQDSLCGDVALGRWGLVAQGDCFVLASDYLNCLVHVIEIGNGLLTFQMRGLEFRGTYCQQREVEAISEGVEEDDGCCCCEPGHLPHMLSANAAFSQRWLAWEVTVSKYVLEGYSIADNSAVSMLQVYDLRKILITYYIKGVIYYTIKAEKMPEWLESEAIRAAMRPTLEKSYAELDPIFNVNIDEDYDFTISGITRNSFCNVYHSWIQHCLTKRGNGTDIPCGRDSIIVSLCFALGILARRALGIAAHSNSLSSVEFFLFGLHALFKGDFRITSQRDEWVFNDMDLLKKVVSPAVRMSLKLHQDHFMCPDEYDDNNALFDAISYHDEHLVISHEGDPAWRSAVLAGREGLLALRHVFDDGADEYKIIMLNKRQLNFRVIKLNRECVRGLWAGQQQELVYLRNRDPERGSIQNAKQALRNIINSSCDQPIGYPIYVSPLTTSYAETHSQLTSLLGGPISLSKIKESAIDLWKRFRHRCVQGCSSGSSLPQEEGGGGEVYGGQEGSYVLAPSNSLPLGGISVSASQSLEGSQIGGSSLGRGSVGRNLSRGSGTSNVSFGKPSTSTLTSLAGFLTDTNGNSRDKERGGVENLKWASLQKVRIVDANQVYDGLNMGRRIDVVWPDDAMRARGGRNYWQNWVPEDGMEGIIVHKWIPGHRDPKSRSITDKTILLLKMEDKFVPIAETGVERIEGEA